MKRKQPADVTSFTSPHTTKAHQTPLETLQGSYCFHKNTWSLFKDLWGLQEVTARSQVSLSQFSRVQTGEVNLDEFPVVSEQI